MGGTRVGVEVKVDTTDVNVPVGKGAGAVVGGTDVGAAVTAGGTGITVDMDRAVASTLGAGSEAHATPKESTNVSRSSGRSFIDRIIEQWPM